MKQYWMLAFHSAYRKKSVTLLCTFGLSITIAFMCISIEGLTSLRQAMILSAESMYGIYEICINGVTNKEIDTLQSSPKITRLAFADSSALAAVDDSGNICAAIAQVDENFYEIMQVELISGRYPQNPGEVVLFEPTAEKLSFDLNTEKKLSFRSLENNILTDKLSYRTVKLVGLLKMHPSQVGRSSTVGFQAPDDDFFSNDLSAYVVFDKKANPIEESMKLVAEGILESSILYNKSLLSVKGFYTTGSLTQSSETIMFLFIAFLIIVAVVTMIYNIFTISLKQKRRQFGLLRAIGATSPQIIYMVTFDGLLFGLLSIPLGLLFGAFLYTPVIERIMSIINSNMKTISLVAQSFSMSTMLAAAFSGLILSLLSCIIPAIHASRVSPMVCISDYEKQFEVRKFGKPINIKHATKELGSIEYYSQGRQAHITVMSLSLGVLLFMCFSGMLIKISPENVIREEAMEGFDFQLTNNMDFVSAHENYIPLELINEIRIYNGVSRVQITRYGELPGTETLTYLVGCESEVYSSFCIDRENNDLSTKDIIYLYYPDGISENQKVYSIGDVVSIYDKNFTIVDTLDEKPRGLNASFILPYLIINSDDYSAVVGNENAMNVQVELTNRHTYEEMEAVKNLLQAIKDNSNHELEMISLDQMMVSAQEAYQFVKVISYGITFLTVIISILNALNTICTSMLNRKNELGMLRAIGATPNQILEMTFFESLNYTSRALFIGLPLGFILFFLLTGEAFEWKVVMEKITFVGLALVGITIVATVFACIIILKSSIIENLSSPK